jgi:hypothetical protein
VFKVKALVHYVKDLWMPLTGISLILLVAYLSAGCITEVVKPEEVVEPDDLVGIAEDYCRSDLTLPCGKVYEFDVHAENPLGLLELCVPWLLHPDRPTLAQAEAEFGPSRLSTDSRFASANLCWWQCPTMRGCNSYSGCYCPRELPTLKINPFVCHEPKSY